MTGASTDIFENIYSEDLIGLRDNTSWKYQDVASFLDFEKNDISKIAGVKKSSVRYDQKIPKEVKDRLEQIGNIILLVAEYFKGDVIKTALWFKTSNPQLGNISPRDMIRLGRYKKLMQFIIAAQGRE